MRRWFIVSALILFLFTVAGVGANYTILPWQYGAIVWVQTPPQAAHSMAEYAAKAVNDVFSFWGVSAPVPAKNWAHPERVSYANGTTARNAIMDAIKRHFAVVSSRSTPVDTLYPPLMWGNNAIYPLFIYVYPTAEAMGYDFADYSFLGSYGQEYSYTPRNADITLPLTFTPKEIFIAHDADWQYIITHELTHWLTEIVGTRAGITPGTLPPVITEGMADYTAHALTGKDLHWRAVAAAWAQSGGKLGDVPPPLWYDVGTSVVAYLVQQEGKQKFISSLPTLATNWPEQANAIAPGWRAALLTVKLTDGDRALYEAKLERLYLCAWLLDPVLPQEAKELIDRIDTGHGTMADIARFWQVVATVPPQPAASVWQRLFHRENTFAIVAARDRMNQAAATQVTNMLGKYWRDWGNYYSWFVTGLHKVIAMWGKIGQTGVNKPQD